MKGNPLKIKPNHLKTKGNETLHLLFFENLGDRFGLVQKPFLLELFYAHTHKTTHKPKTSQKKKNPNRMRESLESDIKERSERAQRELKETRGADKKNFVREANERVFL